MIILALINPSKGEFQDILGKILQRSEYKSLRIVKHDYIQEFKDYLSKIIMSILRKFIANMDTSKAA